MASSEMAELLLAEWVDHRHFEDRWCHLLLDVGFFTTKKNVLVDDWMGLYSYTAILSNILGMITVHEMGIPQQRCRWVRIRFGGDRLHAELH